jgi:hypothetical protein
MEERVFSLYLTRETRARACVDLKGPSLFLISLPAASRWIGTVSSSFVVRPTRDDDEVRASERSDCAGIEIMA